MRWLLLAALLMANVAVANPVERGSALYRGEVEADAISVTVAGLRAEPKTWRCVNCHGEDRSGGSEGGIVAPSVVWSELSRETMRRPGYTSADFSRALREGVSADGVPLHPLMPRAAMSDEDISALIAYLKTPDRIPGVTADRLAVGFHLPEAERSTAGSGVRSALQAAFDVVNERGGIYGRRIVLVDPDAEAVFVRLADFAGGRCALRVLPSEQGSCEAAPMSLSASEDVQLKTLTTARRANDVLRDNDPQAVAAEAAADGFAGKDRLLLTVRSAPAMMLAPHAAWPKEIIVADPFRAAQSGPGRLRLQAALGRAPTAMERHAFVAGLVFTEAAARAGRRLTQKRLVDALRRFGPVRSDLWPMVRLEDPIKRESVVLQSFVFNGDERNE